MDEAVRLFRSTREYLTPVMTESAFHERGILTPEEFVRAGDQLVRTCPSWRWESGEAGKARPYLPADKQFLSTKGVPSYSRVSILEASKLVEESVQGGMGDEEDWCAPELQQPEEGEDEVLVEAADAVCIDAVEGVEGAPASSAPSSRASAGSGVSGAGDDYLDMEDESLALDDAVAPGLGALNLGGEGKGPAPGSHLVRARRYDVSITYDNYYRTPRIWLFGFDENGSALSTTDVYQDIMQDYARKTVTIDPHPHLSRPHGEIGDAHLYL
jgi:ubiquitin-like-conjugating enzyme ATG3